jgi:hypothetical protein
MGTDALRTSGVTEKLLYLIRDPALIPRREPLLRVRRSRVALFVAIELVGFGATMAITQTIGKPKSNQEGVRNGRLMTHICSGDWIPDCHFLVGACEDAFGFSAALHS